MGVADILSKLNLGEKVLPVAGGDVNQTFRVEDGGKKYFLKYHPGVDQHFFQAEIHGLQELAPFVRVPQFIDCGETEDGAYLLLEWIESGTGDQRKIAEALAQIHRQTAPEFGFHEDNFIGILPQVNAQTKSWPKFYLTCRLDVQVELAKLHNVWNAEREEHFLHLKETIWQQWQDLEFTPSLLHGDFWSGNIYFSEQGEPVFVDPAVSYGHREMDIAMSQLFGGFRPEFLEAYHQAFPLENGWQKRMPIYQLYYLLVHLNQFGEGYGDQVDQLLKDF